MSTLIRILLSLCLFLNFVTAASAQPLSNSTRVQDFINRAAFTLDGAPPPEGAACDGLSGAAHGLCTAYCEAMDCDSGSPQASQNACDKVGASFERITGRRPPCDCPCVGQFPGFIEALNGPLLACQIESDPVGDLVVVSTSSGFSPASIFFIGVLAACGDFNDGALFITEPQARVCGDLILLKAAAAGLQCMPF